MRSCVKCCDDLYLVAPVQMAERIEPRHLPKYDFSRLLSSAKCVAAGALSRRATAAALGSPGPRRVVRYSRSGASSLSRAAVVAIVEGRGQARGEIGLASIDARRPVLFLSQFADTQAYIKVMAKLLVLQPLEIVVANTVSDGSKSKMCEFIRNQFTECSLSSMQRRHFNEVKGLQYIKKLCVPEFQGVEHDVCKKYYCLAACAALLKYVEFSQNVVYAPHSLKVSFHGSEQAAMIDVTTAKNLELVLNHRNPSSQHTLYSTLSHTHTAGGARLLRSTILEPPFCLDTIKLRQECVQELAEREELFLELGDLLKRFVDLDHLISLCVQLPKWESAQNCENTITHVICLKQALQLVVPLRQALASASSGLLKVYHKMLNDTGFVVLRQQLEEVVHGDAHFQKGVLSMRTQRCFCLRQGLNGNLDMTRKLYSERIADIGSLIRTVSEQHQLPVRSAHSATRGFHMQLLTGPGSQCAGMTKEQLPREFVKISSQRHMFSFTTAKLMQLNDHAKELLVEIYSMSNIVLKELLADIRQHIASLYKLSGCVAMLDMLHSFAHCCTVTPLVRPEFTDTLAIKQGRHPVLDSMSSHSTVPNNTYASAAANLHIVTGPNMSGKSTYLKQLALLQIMAQIGCFVPANYASFKLVNQVFSRIGSADDMETNASTFMVEMREVAYILQHVTPRSLVIIDELGRGTSSEEGVGLCYAVCEQLHASKAFVFFATHFLELTQLSAQHYNIANFHFEVKRVLDGDGLRVEYTHLLTSGEASEKHYGLQLAEVSSMPAAVVTTARDIAADITRAKESGEDVVGEGLKHRLVYQLVSALQQVGCNSQLDERSLRLYLRKIKENFTAASMHM